MDPVKMKFALALCVSFVVTAAEPVFAQSSSASAALSATVDGVRGRCGLGLLARTTTSQTCQSIKDYGSRMQCVADDLSDEVRAKESPVLAEVADCYRALGNALVAGRGANNDQVNALEDICRKLRHETVVPRSSVARDALLLASDSLMPGFSRKSVVVPTTDPMMGIRLHDLPDCALALALPSGPASAASVGSSSTNRTANGAVTGSVQTPRFANLTPPGVELATASSSSVPAPQSAPQSSSQAVSSSQAEPLPSAGADKLAEGLVDRTVGKTKGRLLGSELSSAAQISESAVINALPSVPAAGRKPSRRTVARVERNQSGYTVKTVDRSQASSRSGAGTSDASDSQSGSSGSRSGSRSSYSTSSNSAISASSPPSLPLMGPPLKPQTAGSVR
jgi:hypothetical protein